MYNFIVRRLLELMSLAFLVTYLSCSEDPLPQNNMTIPELNKPISFEYDSTINNSFKDNYYDMDLAFYIPGGINELKNRPLLFTLATDRTSSVAGSFLPVIEKYGMIAVSPLNGNQIQFSYFLESMIESDYINPEQVYVAGFSNGGMDIYSLAWAEQNKIKGAILLDPSAVFAGDPVENSKLSVCIVCQESRVGQYSGTVAQLNNVGIKSKMISVSGTDHFGILSPYTEQEKIECFEFVRNAK